MNSISVGGGPTDSGAQSGARPGQMWVRCSRRYAGTLGDSLLIATQGRSPPENLLSGKHCGGHRGFLPLRHGQTDIRCLREPLASCPRLSR